MQINPTLKSYKLNEKDLEMISEISKYFYEAHDKDKSNKFLEEVIEKYKGNNDLLDLLIKDSQEKTKNLKEIFVCLDKKPKSQIFYIKEKKLVGFPLLKLAKSFQENNQYQSIASVPFDNEQIILFYPILESFVVSQLQQEYPQKMTILLNSIGNMLEHHISEKLVLIEHNVYKKLKSVQA
jgi:hypothetical protein